MNRSRSFSLSHVTLVAASLMTPLFAQNITTFQNGTVADANAVNANFSALRTATQGAQSAADTAQSTADAAQAAASSAQATASSAQSAANAAQSGVDAINGQLTVSSGVASFDGRVGIGTTTPGGRLQVDRNGDSGPLLQLSGSGLMMKMGEASEWDVYAGGDAFSISRSGIDFPLQISTTTGNVGIGSAASSFKLEVAGNIRCTSLTQTSARALKKDIAPLTGALDSLMRLRSVRYAWNDAAPELVRGQPDIGFLADEVDQVLPEIVAKDANGEAIGIAYGKITSVTVGAIQELKQANDRLAEENGELRRRLEAIEQALAGLKASAGPR